MFQVLGGEGGTLPFHILDACERLRWFKDGLDERLDRLVYGLVDELVEVEFYADVQR